MNQQATKEILSSKGIDFNEDFHSLSSTLLELLVEAAKAHNYRKPKNANGSTARYFFYHLAKIN